MKSTESPTIAWPPEFTVKKHPRARHVKLKASPKNGLEIVVPKNFKEKEIPSILEEHRKWIEKQLLKIQVQTSDADVLPTEIHFAAINQVWRIDYISWEKKLRLISRPQLNELALLGDIENIALCHKALIKWTKEQASIYLIRALTTISQEIQLPFKSATIRNQASRWGSCSADKSINLNYKLLFLPPELTRHILIHELCHTVHLNHSDRFWQLVERFDPEWKTRRRAIHNAERLIPGWVK